jgi:hypothetical protein
MAFNNAIKEKSPARTEYLEALHAFVSSENATESTFDWLVEALARLPVTGERRPLCWPNLTCIPHYYSPDHCPPLKPRAAQETAKLFGLDLRYQPRPNWATYQQWVQFHSRLLEFLRPHGAEDMFDVASLIWVIVRWNVELAAPKAT